MLVVVVVIICMCNNYFYYWHPTRPQWNICRTSTIPCSPRLLEISTGMPIFCKAIYSSNSTCLSTKSLKPSTTCSLQINALLHVGDPSHEFLLFSPLFMVFLLSEKIFFVLQQCRLLFILSQRS